MTFNKYVNICAEAIGEKADIRYVNLEIEKLQARDWFPFRDIHLFGSIDKIKSTGFENKYTLFDGLKKTYKYLEDNQLLNYPQLHKLEE